MKDIRLSILVPVCVAAMFLSACVEKDRNVPANPQSIIAGSDSSPVNSKVKIRPKVRKSAPTRPDSLLIKP